MPVKCSSTMLASSTGILLAKRAAISANGSDVFADRELTTMDSRQVVFTNPSYLIVQETEMRPAFTCRNIDIRSFYARVRTMRLKWTRLIVAVMLALVLGLHWT